MANLKFRRIAKRILLAPVIVPLVIIWPAYRASLLIMRYLEDRRDRWRELNADQKEVCRIDRSITEYHQDIAACFARACACGTPEEVERHLRTAWHSIGAYAAMLQSTAIISGRFFEERNDIR